MSMKLSMDINIPIVFVTIAEMILTYILTPIGFHAVVFIICAGFPATMTPAGTSLVTTVCAAITAPSPMVTPFMMQAPNPIHTSSLMQIS